VRHRDIYRIVREGLLTKEACWELWLQKNVHASLHDAKLQALTHLTRLEARRPLTDLPVGPERTNAKQLREWFREGFLS
jgi:hypothetical protein